MERPRKPKPPDSMNYFTKWPEADANLNEVFDIEGCAGYKFLLPLRGAAGATQ
jgi:hypothetical protein